MRNIVKKRWKELSPIWGDLVDNNPTATPFQSYEFLTFTGKGKAQREDLFRLIGLRELNLVLYKDEEVTAIAPLLIKKKGGRFFVYLRGHFTTANQLDFIYKNWEYEDAKFLLDGIKSMLGNVSFEIDRVSQKTITCEYLKKYFASDQIVERECFSITIPENFEDWHGSLRKSVRRNLRTWNNRLERDKVKQQISIIYKKKIDMKTCRKMMYVYANRFMVKNKVLLGPLSRFINRVLMIFLMRDKMTRWMNRPKNNFHLVLYLNDEIAALTCGVICKDKRVILSRFAIDVKYGYYSPGGILISSAIKYIVEQRDKGNLDFKELDLSEGGSGGMAYKKAYGGQIHYVYTFKN